MSYLRTTFRSEVCSTTAPAHGPKHTAPSRISVPDEVSTCENVGRDEEEEEEGQHAEGGDEEDDIEKEEEATCETVGRGAEEEEEGQAAEESDEEGDVEVEEETTQLAVAAQVFGSLLVTVPLEGVETTQRAHGHGNTERSFSWDH